MQGRGGAEGGVVGHAATVPRAVGCASADNAWPGPPAATFGRAPYDDPVRRACCGRVAGVFTMRLVGGSAMIQFKCNCGQTLRVPESLAGDTTQCPPLRPASERADAGRAGHAGGRRDDQPVGRLDATVAEHGRRGRAGGDGRSGAGPDRAQLRRPRPPGRPAPDDDAAADARRRRSRRSCETGGRGFHRPAEVRPGDGRADDARRFATGRPTDHSRGGTVAGKGGPGGPALPRR